LLFYFTILTKHLNQKIDYIVYALLAFALSPNKPTLNYPANTLVIFDDNVTLNATVTDPDADNLVASIYVNQNQSRLNDAYGLVYKDNVPSGSDITYDLTAMPVRWFGSSFPFRQFFCLWRNSHKCS